MPLEEIDLSNPLMAQFWTEDPAVVDQKLKTIRQAPPAFYPEAPTEGIGIPDGPGGWAIAQYELILEVSRTPEVYSSAQGITIIDTPDYFNEFFGSMIAMDDPRHARLRRLVSKGFTPRMLQRLESSVFEKATEIIDAIADRGECDFVTDVAAQLPLSIVCDLMGVPASQIDFVFDQTNIILGASDPEFVPDGTDIVASLLGAGGALAELMASVAEQKRGRDGDDLTSILVNAEIEGERLTTAEIASFFILLVVAGNETTRNAISWGLHYLTTNPIQREIWQNDVARATPFAVEEIVRLASPVNSMRRTAVRDSTLGGVEIAAGDKLVLFYSAANRDEQHFPEPLSFDVLRDPNRHLGFGGPGPHYCLGAHLARLEIGAMFTELFGRLPDIEASAAPTLLQSNFIRGIKRLPARFAPALPFVAKDDATRGGTK